MYQRETSLSHTFNMENNSAVNRLGLYTCGTDDHFSSLKNASKREKISGTYLNGQTFG